MKHYTLGEIYRLGLLKNKKGEPYKSKGAVSAAIAIGGIKKKEKMTKFGISFVIAQVEIDRYNALIRSI